MNIDFRHWEMLQQQHKIAFDCAINLDCKIIRTVLKPDEAHEWNDWYAVVHSYNMELLAVLARESGNHWEQYKNYKFDYLQVGNEPFSSGDSSYEQSYNELNADLLDAKIRFPNVYRILAGLADGNPEHLDHIKLELVDAIAAHPGIETPETIANFLARYKAHAQGKPLWITEFYDVELIPFLPMDHSMFFCYDDIMVEGHGLYKDGVAKPRYHRYVALVNGGNMNVGQGILDAMQDHDDSPIRDSEFINNQDGSTYEKGFGIKGFYEASNAGGSWNVYFRPYNPLA